MHNIHTPHDIEHVRVYALAGTELTGQWQALMTLYGDLGYIITQSLKNVIITSSRIRVNLDENLVEAIFIDYKYPCQS